MANKNFNPFPVLETERLTLRQLTDFDVTDIYRLRRNEEVNRYLQRLWPGSEEHALDFIRDINDGINNNTWIYWAITLSGSDNVIGTVALWKFDAYENSAELGYELLPAFQGQGIMREALTAILDHAFNVISLSVIEASTHKNNVKSIKLLNKLRFDFVPGKLDTENPAHIIYRIDQKSFAPGVKSND